MLPAATTMAAAAAVLIAASTSTTGVEAALSPFGVAGITSLGRPAAWGTVESIPRGGSTGKMINVGIPIFLTLGARMTDGNPTRPLCYRTKQRRNCEKLSSIQTPQDRAPGYIVFRERRQNRRWLFDSICIRNVDLCYLMCV